MKIRCLKEAVRERLGDPRPVIACECAEIGGEHARIVVGYGLRSAIEPA